MPPAPPLDVPPAPRRHLTRSRTSKVIGGVAGGVGNYLGVDPVIVRVALVVILLTTNGMVLLAYLLALFVIPKSPKNVLEDQGPPGANPVRTSRSSLGAIVLLGIGCLGLLDLIGLESDGGLLWPLALIGFGVAVLWSRRTAPPIVAGANGAIPPTPTPTPTGPSTINSPLSWPTPSRLNPLEGREGASELDPELDPIRRPFQSLLESAIVQRAYDRPQSLASAPTPPPSAPSATSANPEPANRKACRKVRRSRTSYSTVATALFLVAVGFVWLAAQTRWDPTPRSVMGGLLFLLGSLTLVGTWFGRPRLLMIGVLMTVTLAATSLAGLRFEGPFGEEVVTMNTPAAFASTQSMEIGALTLDLTNVPTEGALQVLSGEVAIGELKVIVPTDVELTIDAEVRIGAVTVFGVEKLSGLSQSGTIQIPAERPPVRKVKARLRTNIGAITVVRPVTESLLLDAPESSRPRPTTIGR